MATNLKNLGNSENSKNCRNLRENAGKFEFLQKNLEKPNENVKFVTLSPMKMYFGESFSPELLRKKIEYALEIS